MSKVKLKDVVSYSKERGSREELVLETYITTDNLLQNKSGVTVANSLPVNGDTFPKYKKNEILISNIRPYLKKIWFSDRKGICSADVLTFSVNTDFDPKFVYYNLFQDEFFEHAMKGSKGTKMPRGDKNQILEFQIPKFQLPTQQKIAAILSALDDKIELNNKINENLEQQAKLLYDYWFVQNRDENWEVKTIGDYCASTGGFAFKSSWWTESGTPVIKIKDIQENNTLNLSDLSFVNLAGKKIETKFLAKAGNVVIAMTGATVGKFAIVPFSAKEMYVNQRVGYFNLGEDPFKKLPFLINSLQQSYFREAIFSLAKGAAQPNISNEQINSIRLLMPSKKLIDNFNLENEAIYQKILLNQHQNQQLSALRDFLLPMLMNGQVKVE